MKSIANQYKDLKEGRMSQFNFMRNLRMSMPQVTNTTSFSDAVKILKNKGIISEAFSQAAQDENYDTVGTDGYDNVSEVKSKAEEIAELRAEIEALMASGSHQDPEIVSDKIDDIKAKIAALKAEKNESLNEAKEPKGSSGKEQYSKFTDAENDNFQEVITGIHCEHEHNPEKTYEEIVKIVLKNLKKAPHYYTMYKLSGGVEDAITTMDKTNTPEVMAMKVVKDSNLVDKGRPMKKVKMPKTEEKKKLKEAIDDEDQPQKMHFKDLPADPEKYKIVRDSKGYIIKATNSDGVEFQKGEVVKTYDGEEIKIAKFEESQGKVKAIYSTGMFYRGIDIDGLEAPKPTMRPGVDIGKSFEKWKMRDLKEMVRQAMAEMYDGRDNLDAEIED
jgi:hypothetical protein